MVGRVTVDMAPDRADPQRPVRRTAPGRKLRFLPGDETGPDPGASPGHAHHPRPGHPSGHAGATASANLRGACRRICTTKTCWERSGRPDGGEQTREWFFTDVLSESWTVRIGDLERGVVFDSPILENNPIDDGSYAVPVPTVKGVLNAAGDSIVSPMTITLDEPMPVALLDTIGMNWVMPGGGVIITSGWEFGAQ
jgi:hypothetical protein